MRLLTLLSSIGIDEELKVDRDIKGIHYNSKYIEEDFIFIAIKGHQFDGHDFIDDAISNGAVAVIAEREVNNNLSIPCYIVEDSRKCLSLLASKFYQFPSQHHRIIGITGTNGKTTVSFMLYHILKTAGKTCSLIGTVYHIINGKTYDSSHTTPDALTLHKLLSKSNDEFVIIEVSSHGLDQGRVDEIGFDYALFTNLTHDHLNYHHNLQAYFASKLKLFDLLNKKSGQAIVSTYTKFWSEKLVHHLMMKEIPVTTVGAHSHNDVIDYSNEFSNELIWSDSLLSMSKLTIPKTGVYQNRNALLAFVTAETCGINRLVIKEALMSFTGVPGRFEMITYSHSRKAVIDYAHSPDAIYACLKTVKKFKPDKIIHVFGFRGDGDSSKRKKMLSFSVELSDLTILCLDDLNGMSLEEMEVEWKRLTQSFNQNKIKMIPDRTLAIKFAMEQAIDDSWVVITGKGHENYKQNFSINSNTDKESVMRIKDDIINYSK
ncbi:UDP-N-acetylmuramyl tripeptide synthase [Bacillus sp. TS-2]|nr:UDP-N-acetylmuramyl tripeptide synthase [Bacillus sp. TS-2]